MKIITPRTALFGPYALDLRSGELRKFGTKVKMGEQAFQILCLLLERPGEMVSREELRAKLWADDTFVDFDHGLNSAVQRLRDCLSDSAGKPRWIETLPRRGYRFIGQVEWSDESPAAETFHKTRIGIRDEISDDVAQSSVTVESSKAPRRADGTSRRIALLAAMALVLFLAAIPIVRRFRGEASAKQALLIKSLAVLPLENPVWRSRPGILRGRNDRRSGSTVPSRAPGSRCVRPNPQECHRLRVLARSPATAGELSCTASRTSGR